MQHRAPWSKELNAKGLLASQRRTQCELLAKSYRDTIKMSRKTWHPSWAAGLGCRVMAASAGEGFAQLDQTAGDGPKRSPGPADA